MDYQLLRASRSRVCVFVGCRHAIRFPTSSVHANSMQSNVDSVRGHSLGGPVVMRAAQSDRSFSSLVKERLISTAWKPLRSPFAARSRLTNCDPTAPSSPVTSATIAACDQGRINSTRVATRLCRTSTSFKVRSSRPSRMLVLQLRARSTSLPAIHSARRNANCSLDRILCSIRA